MNFLRMLALGSYVISFLFGAPKAWQIDAPQPQSPDGDRLVVFEGLLEPGDHASASTGPVIEQLATKYAGRVVFLEYNSLIAQSEDRKDRWKAGYLGSNPALPWTMVDSGFLTHAGFTSAAASFAEQEAMILEALARPPQADVSASYERIGNSVRFHVRVVNRSGVTLSSTNLAAVHVIVYEDKHVQYTDRFVRAYAAIPISRLPSSPLDDNTKVYTVDTEPITGVDWNKLHYIALVDYQTLDGTYDMLQAAVATTPISVSPRTLMFTAPVGGPNPASKTITINGPAGAAWSASESATWMTVAPTTGTIPGEPVVSVNVSGLNTGIYVKKITCSASISQDVTVIAAIGDIHWVNLPLIVR